jgi:GNAT superfamily N-acetyltransferase
MVITMIRYLNKQDIPEYQKLITKVWQQTYPGIVNQNFLDNLSKTEPQRIELNNMIYDESIKDTLVLELDNKLVGFIRYGTTDDKNYPNTGEIFALYLLDTYKGKGYGKQLVQQAIKELLNIGHTNMIIGCISQNPSNEFYKHLGGIKKSERPFTKTGDNLIENIYYFQDINNLL